jgi:hypothetical protein
MQTAILQSEQIVTVRAMDFFVLCEQVGSRIIFSLYNG